MQPFGPTTGQDPEKGRAPWTQPPAPHPGRPHERAGWALLPREGPGRREPRVCVCVGVGVGVGVGACACACAVLPQAA